MDDPFDALDTEAARLDRFFAGLSPDQWRVDTRCTGWDRRAMLAHLVGIEEYIRAGLDGRVAEYASQGGDLGYREFNEYKVASLAEEPTAELFQRWRRLVATEHARLRERGVEGTLDTHAGPYPAGRQTWYFATELAVHADDMRTPVEPGLRAERLAWRVDFARDAVSEAAPEVTVTPLSSGFRVSAEGYNAELSSEELVAACSGRSAEGALPAVLRSALVVFA